MKLWISRSNMCKLPVLKRFLVFSESFVITNSQMMMQMLDWFLNSKLNGICIYWVKCLHLSAIKTQQIYILYSNKMITSYNPVFSSWSSHTWSSSNWSWFYSMLCWLIFFIFFIFFVFSVFNIIETGTSLLITYGDPIGGCLYPIRKMIDQKYSNHLNFSIALIIHLFLINDSF